MTIAICCFVFALCVKAEGMENIDDKSSPHAHQDNHASKECMTMCSTLAGEKLMVEEDLAVRSFDDASYRDIFFDAMRQVIIEPVATACSDVAASLNRFSEMSFTQQVFLGCMLLTGVSARVAPYVQQWCCVNSMPVCTVSYGSGFLPCAEGSAGDNYGCNGTIGSLPATWTSLKDCQLYAASVGINGQKIFSPNWHGPKLVGTCPLGQYPVIIVDNVGPGNFICNQSRV